MGLGKQQRAALKSDNTLWAWGGNNSGQLGDGTTADKSAPVLIGTDNKWVSVMAGYGHTIALKSDGTLWAWGHNSSGELGDGTTAYKSEPLQIGADRKWVSTALVPEPVAAKVEAVRITGGTNMAVAEFVGKNVSQADASIVTDFLRTELVSTGLFNVMDRNNMDTVLAEQKFQNSGCTEQECAVEMGKLLNIKQILVGSLSKLMDSYYITVNVVDVETGKITASYNSDPVSSKELKDACQKIVKKLSQK
ncbi:MAG: CsgG/HfaB family protein [Elusimicrobiota bacterium]|nr:CsgG/HfaB family protein [Elusimicrobiota bacterium]